MKSYLKMKTIIRMKNLNIDLNIKHIRNRQNHSESQNQEKKV